MLWLNVKSYNLNLFCHCPVSPERAPRTSADQKKFCEVWKNYLEIGRSKGYILRPEASKTKFLLLKFIKFYDLSRLKSTKETIVLFLYFLLHGLEPSRFDDFWWLMRSRSNDCFEWSSYQSWKVILTRRLKGVEKEESERPSQDWISQQSFKDIWQ